MSPATRHGRILLNVFMVGTLSIVTKCYCNMIKHIVNRCFVEIHKISLFCSQEPGSVAFLWVFLYYALVMATKSVSKDKEIAVILTGGKQYVVSVGDTVEVELLSPLGALKEGDVVTFDQVLLMDNGTDTTIGTPYIPGAKVTAKFVADIKAQKISILRYKAKSNRDRKIGHRQKYSKVTIEAFK